MAATMVPTERIECDVLVVGGGAAALLAALEARKSVDRVVLACKRKAGRSGNTLVAGANFSVCVPCDEVSDSPDQHLRDTLEAGDGSNDPALAQRLASDAAEAVLGLEQYGVAFLRSQGSLVRRRAPGHSRPRSIPTDPAGHTHVIRGLSITLPLLKCALQRGITVLSDTPVLRLLVNQGEVCGALAFDTSSGAGLLLQAKAVVLAAGGGGQLFDRTNNTLEMTGDSYALALEAGAALRDLEFVQFYPAQMFSPLHASVPSTLFGEGAVLRSRSGERFMPRHDPKGDMATRDVMCRAIFREVQAGEGVDGGVYMDLSAVPLPALELKFSTILDLLLSHRIDPAAQQLLVSPVAHFFMGGAWIDPECRTTVPGLFAGGEAAGGVHGADRLAGNALTETAVFGTRAGREAAAYARAHGPSPDLPAAPFEMPTSQPGSLTVAEVKSRLRQVLWEHASIVRSETGLRKAESALKECVATLPRCRVESPANALAFLEVERMAKVGLCVIAAALERKESRGAHFREDYPERNDARWRGSTRLQKAGDTLEISFVPV